MTIQVQFQPFVTTRTGRVTHWSNPDRVCYTRCGVWFDPGYYSDLVEFPICKRCRAWLEEKDEEFE